MTCLFWLRLCLRTTQASSLRGCEAPRAQVVRLPVAPRRRHVTRADLRRYGVTVGCAACSDILVRGDTAKLDTDGCRARLGQQMEHDPEGQERLQAHKRKRDVELEVGEAPVAAETADDPAPLRQQNVAMPSTGNCKPSSLLSASQTVLPCVTTWGAFPEPRLQDHPNAENDPIAQKQSSSTTDIPFWRKVTCNLMRTLGKKDLASIPLALYIPQPGKQRRKPDKRKIGQSQKVLQNFVGSIIFLQLRDCVKLSYTFTGKSISDQTWTKVYPTDDKFVL